MTRRLGIAALVLTLGGALWYLRDPAWLAGQTTGLRGWERGPDGTAYRWSGGHASFFVPADARQVRIPIATTFDPRAPRGDDPMLVTFTIDDVRAGRALLDDTRVQDVIVTLPRRETRRVRRIDVRTNITREGNHGVKIGEVMITRDGNDWQSCCLGSR
jgi:hypothetical protein